MPDPRDFDDLLEKFRRHREVMKEELHKVIIGQDAVIDQMLAAIWQSGAMKMTVDPKKLSVVDLNKYLISDLKVTTDFLLPPLLNDCGWGGATEVQIGDIGLNISAQMDGKPGLMKVYLSAAAKVQAKLIYTKTGKQIALNMSPAHLIENDIDSVLVDGKVAPEGTVSFFEALLPVLTQVVLKQFQGTLASFPLPELDLAPLVAGADYVFHIAARAGVRGGWGDIFDAYQFDNVTSTQRLLEAFRLSPGARQLILASTSSIYGRDPPLPTPESTSANPQSYYAITKLACEKLAVTSDPTCMEKRRNWSCASSTPTLVGTRRSISAMTR